MAAAAMGCFARSPWICSEMVGCAAFEAMQAAESTTAAIGPPWRTPMHGSSQGDRRLAPDGVVSVESPLPTLAPGGVAYQRRTPGVALSRWHVRCGGDLCCQVGVVPCGGAVAPYGIVLPSAMVAGVVCSIAEEAVAGGGWNLELLRVASSGCNGSHRPRPSRL